MDDTGLPTYPAPFVGRAEELARITSLLNDRTCRLLTLVGPGGIGKTRLATEVGHRYQGKSDHRVCFVALQPMTSPEFISSAIADAVHFQFYPGSDPRQQLIAFLRERSLLLVLDNFEHVLDGADLVSEILGAAPDLKVLATSRERLSLLEEWVLEVPGLPYPQDSIDTQIEDYDAVRMFVENARRIWAGFTLDDTQKRAVARICQLVGGMPLALELAASWVRLLSCAQIAAEIEHSLDILTTSMRNLPPRHKNIRIILEHSWNALTNDERTVFSQLSVFRGGFSPDAAKSVADASLPVLSSLVDKSFLRVVEHGRLNIHELLRHYGEEQLQACGQSEATRNRHSAYFAALLQQNWQLARTSRMTQALQEIEAEFENVRTAWQNMIEQRNADEMSSAIYGLSWFACLRGRYPEAMQLFEQADAALQSAPGNERVLGQLRSERSSFFGYVGQAEAGRELAQQGLRMLQRVGSAEDVALAWQGTCLMHMWLDEIPLLKQEAEEAVAAARRSGDRWILGRSLWFAAAADIELDLHSAVLLGQEGFGLAEMCGDPHLRALFAGVLGNVAQRKGDYAEARHWFENGLDGYTQVCMVEGIAQSHIALGVVSVCLKDYHAAAYHYRQSLITLSDQEGFVYIQLYTLLNTADLWVAQQQQSRAVELFSLIVNHPSANPLNRVYARQHLAQLRAEVEPALFTSAQERGMQQRLDRAILEVLTELDRPAPMLAMPLSKRELEVLHLAGDHLTNAEIAQKLFISVGTVKVHLRKIYAKLGVSSRTHAVDQAHKLHLL